MIRSTPPEAEDGAAAAGREAEEAVRRVIGGQFSGKGGSVFSSRRVPRDPAQPFRNRGEIDLVVLTRRQLWAIEIKAWSGRVRMEGRDWVQERRSGGSGNHGDLLAQNAGKLEALGRMLQAGGVRPPARQASLVLFWNPNLTMPKDLADRDDVVMRHEFDEMLARQKAVPLGQRIMLAMMDLCLDAERRSGPAGPQEMSRGDYRRAVEGIAALESFDKVQLRGGRVLAGDIWELNVGGSSMGFKRIKRGSVMPVSLRALLPLRACFGPRLMTLRQRGTRIHVAPDDFIAFQGAGQAGRERIPFARIEGLVRG